MLLVCCHRIGRSHLSSHNSVVFVNIIAVCAVLDVWGFYIVEIFSINEDLFLISSYMVTVNSWCLVLCLLRDLKHAKKPWSCNFPSSEYVDNTARFFVVLDALCVSAMQINQLKNINFNCSRDEKTLIFSRSSIL